MPVVTSPILAGERSLWRKLSRDFPIGIFDSGVGGLTVYRALHNRLPDERFIYLGDTARVPYGNKSAATVERYSIENARFLESHGIKLLIVACNTASALALPAIRQRVSVPVVGVIEPGARAAAVLTIAEKANRKRVGVIATQATVRSAAYRRAIERRSGGIEVIERACPLFVPLVEEGWAETEVARAVAGEYLKDLRERELTALVLGCTHYPMLRRVIQEAIGERVRLIDSGEATAHEVQYYLASEGLARPATHREMMAPARQLCDDLDHFYVTDAEERFARVAESFLGSAPSMLEAVEL
ncbi:MAG: glutamate racemase [Pyrinomonadaceae bacterium]